MNVLRYQLALQSPLPLIQRFFEIAFPQEQLQSETPILTWKNMTEDFVRNLTVLPLSNQFNHVYLAAAYLAFTKQFIKDNGGIDVPDEIAGYPWFAFVDPAIEQDQLDFITVALGDDFKFLYQLLEQDDQSKQTETPNKSDASQEVSPQQQVYMADPNLSAMPTRTTTPEIQRQPTGGQQVIVSKNEEEQVIVVMQNEQW